jgi:hypothetical protein
MRQICLASAIVTACLSGTVFGQREPSQPDSRSILDKLEKHGISVHPYFDRKEQGQRAYVVVRDAETVKALDLLRQVNNLSAVSLHLSEAGHTLACLKGIENLAKVKKLAVHAQALTTDDLKIISRMKQLDDLTLKCAELSDAQMKELHALKALKNLELSCCQVSPKSLDNLKRALPQVKVDFRRVPEMFFLAELRVSDADDVLTKLQKEKYNVALTRVLYLDERMMQGTIDILQRREGLNLPYEAVRQLTDAAVDLNDPKLAMKIIDGCVELMREYSDLAEELQKAGIMSPDEANRIRYYFLDAQILQIRHKKKR